MKKQFLGLAVAVAMIASINTGCSSEKAASGSDTTAVTDTAATAKPVTTDTAGRDTARKDTSRTNPPVH